MLPLPAVPESSPTTEHLAESGEKEHCTCTTRHILEPLDSAQCEQLPLSMIQRVEIMLSKEMELIDTDNPAGGEWGDTRFLSAYFCSRSLKDWVDDNLPRDYTRNYNSQISELLNGLAYRFRI